MRLLILPFLVTLPVFAQSTAIPANFQTAYSAAATGLQNLEGGIHWDGTPSPVVWTGESLLTDSNQGLVLLTKSTERSAYLQEFAALKKVGYNAITVNLGFPILYEPFYEFNGDPQDYPKMLSFWQQVITDAHSMGLKVVAEGHALFVGYYSSGSGLNVQGYFASLGSVEAYAQAKAVQEATIYNMVHPDWLNLGSEPSTEAFNSGYSELGTASGWAQALATEVSQIPQPHPGTLIGTGLGNWEVPDEAAFIQMEAAISAIDYIDLHFYPVLTLPSGTSLGQNIDTLVGLAKATGKPVACSEYWLTKADPAVYTSTNLSTAFDATDALSFWEPLDEEFLTDIYKLANANDFLFASAFWTRYLWAYVPYEANQTNPQIDSASITASTLAMANGQMTGTGVIESALLHSTPTNAAIVNSASGGTGVAVGSIASIYGMGLANAAADSTVQITDSLGNSMMGTVIYSGTTQINFILPTGIAAGPSVVTITPAGGTPVATTVDLLTDAPGLFSKSGTGQGVAAAETLTFNNGSSNYQLGYVYSASGGTFQVLPIDVSQPNTQVYLVLYGTGISGAPAGSVQVTINNVPAQVSFAGATGQYPGEDQINVLLPASLAGSGQVPVAVSINGTLSNVVQIAIQ